MTTDARTPNARRDSRRVSSIPATSIGSRLLLVAALALLALLGMLPLWTLPAVVPASAPATEFSAERAMGHLREVAREPHPLGSPANAEVRDYLLRELRALGLQPEVQKTTATNRFPGMSSFAAGTVENVVVRIPGTASTGAIALDAHYDGAATGPGASDCGSCVVALLETARALSVGPPLKNDVVLLFADGEENMDLGAAAFVAEHPLAQDVRLALNFEAMAAGGPSLMYFTSLDNAWIVGEAARAAPLPLGQSFFSSFVRLFPEQQFGCDLEEYLNAGASGLGFIYYMDDMPAYHSVRDSVDNIDPRSVQHHGSYALSLARHFGNFDLAAPRPSGDAVFFNLLPGVLAVYPTSWAPPLAALVGLLFVGALGVGLARRALSAGGLIVGALVFPLAVVVPVLLATLGWAGVKAASPSLQVFMIGNYASDLYLLGFGCLLIAAMAALYALLFRRVRVANLTAGAMLVWGLAMVATSVAAPAMSYVFTWPLLSAVLGLGWTIGRTNRADRAANSRSGEGRAPATALVLALAALPVLAIVLPVTSILFPLFSRLDSTTALPLMTLTLILVAPSLGLLLPHLAFLAGGAESGGTLATRRRWLVPAVALAASVLIVAVATTQSGFSVAHPRPSGIAYRLDVDHGEAAWLSVDRESNPWLAQFFPDGLNGPRVEPLPYLGLPAVRTPAPQVALAAPEAIVLDDALDGDTRTLRLRLVSPRRASHLDVEVEAPGEIVSATLAGKALDLSDLPSEGRRRLQVSYNGLPAEGIELTLAIRATGPVLVELRDGSTGLPTIPGQTIAPRPAELMPVPGATVLDPTVVRRTVRLP